jgi:hypothetical protein
MRVKGGGGHLTMTVPTILAGPILRRVEPHAIYVWIATSKRFRIEGELYEIHAHKEKDSYHSELLSDCTETKTLRLGKKLFANLIKIVPRTGEEFPTHTLLGYNLFFNRRSRTKDLRSLDLLSPTNPHSIAYGNLPYPTFYIPNNKETKLLYGSCRKPHGKGGDSLAGADLQLQETHSNLSERPSALFLMGDQIYADDVADPLQPMLSRLGEELMGTRREENLVKLDARLKQEPFQTGIDQIHGRQFIMENFCRFTSKQAHNHLMRFGEYAAMYLLSWGPQLWTDEENRLDSFDEAIQKNNIYFIHPQRSPYHEDRKKERAQHQARYNEQSRDLFNFQSTLPQIRRLLANIPTYMIFDDHDVTDDWNLTRDWKSNVWHSPLGRHVIANGLAAYWVFQGWGNDPESYHHRFIRRMRKYFKSFRIESSAYEEWVKELWDYDAWQFVAPTQPKSVFLDTRTQRSYDPSPRPVLIGKIMEENKQSPQLLSQAGWDRVTERLFESGWTTGQSLMIVSPRPLYGLGLIESFLHKYIYPLRVMGISVTSTLDMEAWKYNGKGFSNFLYTIAKWNPSHCFILSGDVHCAYSVKSNICFGDHREANVFQLTSSPSNNMSFSGVGGFLMKSAIWLNSKKRKNKNINRYCDSFYTIIDRDSASAPPSSFIWKDRVSYLPMDNGAIIETNNNLGLMALSAQCFQNSLLRYNEGHLQRVTFDPIHLQSKTEQAMNE